MRARSKEGSFLALGLTGTRVQVWGESLAVIPTAAQVNRAIRHSQEEAAMSWRVFSDRPGSCMTRLEAGSSWGLGGHRHVARLLWVHGCRWGSHEKQFVFPAASSTLCYRISVPQHGASGRKIDSEVRAAALCHAEAAEKGKCVCVCEGNCLRVHTSNTTSVANASDLLRQCMPLN